MARHLQSKWGVDNLIEATTTDKLHLTKKLLAAILLLADRSKNCLIFQQ